MIHGRWTTQLQTKNNSITTEACTNYNIVSLKWHSFEIIHIPLSLHIRKICLPYSRHVLDILSAGATQKQLGWKFSYKPRKPMLLLANTHLIISLHYVLYYYTHFLYLSVNFVGTHHFSYQLLRLTKRLSQASVIHSVQTTHGQRTQSQILTSHTHTPKPSQAT